MPAILLMAQWRQGQCPNCLVLFDEMRLAVSEAAVITQQAGLLIRASKPSEHVDGWRQIRERWEDARQKWLAAAANLKNHVATTPVLRPPTFVLPWGLAAAVPEAIRQARGVVMLNARRISAAARRLGGVTGH